MQPIDWLVAVWAVVGCLGWTALFLRFLYQMLRLTIVERLRPPEPPTWPRLSVVVAARDEVDHIEAALESLRAVDYPNLELIVVDDRSTDGTGPLLDRLASRDPRIRPLHVTTLPDGWLGKVHALHTATAHATGEFILYTDADVHFAPGTLRRAIAHVVEQRLDQFTVAPTQMAQSFWTRVAVAGFTVLFFAGFAVHRVGRPGSRAYVGVGAFNLVRRTAFARTPGFEWLRMDVADDVGLGLMMQRIGGRCAFALSIRDVSLTWYPSLGAMVRGLEKNTFGPGTNYSYLRLIAQLSTQIAFVLAPLVALLPIPIGWLWMLPLVAYGALAVTTVITSRIARQSVLPALLSPIGFGVMVYTIARSGYRCWRQGGIVWRDTHYPIAALRAGQRVKILP